MHEENWEKTLYEEFRDRHIYTKETDLWKYDVTYSTGMTKSRIEFDIQFMWKE